MGRGELWIAVVLLALGGFIAVVSLVMGTGSVNRPGPGAFPLLVGVLLIVSAIAALRAQRGPGPRAAVGGGLVPVGLVVLVLVAWAALTPIAGHLPMTFLAVVAIARIMRLPTWWKPLVLGVLVTASAYVLFVRWLGVELPRGILG